MYSPALLVLSLLFPAVIFAHPDLSKRQDQPATDDGASDTGDSNPSSTDNGSGASASASAVASADTASVAASPSPTATSGATLNVGNVLGGAGQGQGIPVSCGNCDGSYVSVVSCVAQGTSDTCSPICSNYTSTFDCISCLVYNGQPDLDQDMAQQVVWNLEASCSSLGTDVQSLTVTAAPTTTGSFTTPAGASITGSVQSTAMASHSGITVYNSVIQPFSANGKISTSQAQNPTSTTSGSAGLKTLLPIGVGHMCGLSGLVLISCAAGAIGVL